ncbi:MAG TPA: YbhB/YbcL family Raf kinase inhibitor-like protein [Candidatus Paceibacterota bacterium]
MRGGYAVCGILFLALLSAVLYFNSAFIPRADTGIDTLRRSLDELALQSAMATSTQALTLSLSSSAFESGDTMPSEYTCDADEVSPPLSVAGAPEGTRSFVLVMEDPDVPKIVKPDGVFLHWLVFNIPSEMQEVPEGGMVGVSGHNGMGKEGYIGPCPPPQYEPSEHRYFFKLYALDSMLGLSAGATKEEVMQAMQGHILGETELMGRYKRT